MNDKRRKLINFGIFSRSTIKGQEISNKTMLSIYQKLKQAGFKETPWQYIYSEQVAGLVLPHGDGKNEIHIRFFEDRIFAEFEIGRAYLSHFIGKRFNANSFILREYGSCLSTEEIDYLNRCFSPDLHRQEEIRMALWDGVSDLFKECRSAERTVWGVLAIFYMIDTKACVFMLLMLAMVISFTLKEYVVISCITTVVGSFFTFVALPSKGRP